MEQQLPRYRCHKEVRSFKIDQINPGRLDGQGPGATLVSLTIPLSISVGEEYLHKHDPEPGGYYVRYADGYESFSPCAAFEEGYTLIS